MKSIFALLLAAVLACYPVFATEVTNDTGYDSEFSDVSVAEADSAEAAVSPAADGSLSDVETVSVSDAESVSPAGDSGSADADSVSGEEVGNGDVSAILSADTSNPLPVTVVEPDAVYQSVTAEDAPAVLAIVDDPPGNPPFYGCGYITGTTSNGSTVTLYFPINYKSGYWGTDSNGYLFNVSSSSISGYYAGAYNNSVSCSGFSYPRYRTSSSSYDYVTLYITPIASNMDIATETTPVVSVTDILPYVSILLLGVILLCCMRKS